MQKMWLSALMVGSVALASPAAAQGWGAVELGPFARFQSFDGSLGLTDEFGFGGRLGLFVLPRLEIEGDVSRTNTNLSTGSGHVRHTPIHARLLYNQPVGSQMAFIIGGGFAHAKYEEDVSGSESGGGGLIGWRVLPASWASIRADFSVDYFGNPVNKGAGVSSNWDKAFTVGMSFIIGGKRERPAPPPVVTAPPPQPPPVVDSDGDGVPDSVDKCPNTPAGTKVDADGCPVVTPAPPPPPVVDSDGDGVPDSVDKCPNTPAGTKVDANGCPIVFEEKKTAVVLQGVNFEINKAVLLADSKSVLDQVAASLVANPAVRVEVAGYTDNTGAKAHNEKLSQDRADAVRAYLVEKGVSPDQLIAKGYGESQPIASNATAAGRAQNRRVELHKLN